VNSRKPLIEVSGTGATWVLSLCPGCADEGNSKTLSTTGFDAVSQSCFKNDYWSCFRSSQKNALLLSPVSIDGKCHPHRLPFIFALVRSTRGVSSILLIGVLMLAFTYLHARG